VEDASAAKLTLEQETRRYRLMSIALEIADPRHSLASQADRIGPAAMRFDLMGDQWAAEIIKMGTGPRSG
jgi:hypothetical protein